MNVFQDSLIRKVRDHAEAEYDNGEGWDYIVEAYDDEEVRELIGDSRTAAEAIERCRLDVLARVAYAAEIQAEAF